MVSDSELIQRAKDVINPRLLSRNAEAGQVGAALVTVGGTVYAGVCIDTACSMGFCAEHNAIGNMVTAGEQDIETIVAVNKEGHIIAPCGRCREFIYQISGHNAKTRVILKDGKSMTIQELLPQHWKTTL